MAENVNVAIDGPAGAGKSTISRAAAAHFGFIYVDTGALYRTVGLNALRSGLDPDDAEAVNDTLGKIKVSLRFLNGIQHVFLYDEDVSEAIRTPEASMAASAVSAIPAVRDYLFDLQKSIARENNCVMDGRDIGTVVLPDAKIKIFLTASAQVRAKRRCAELLAKGIEQNYDDVLAEMIQRDYNDSHRAAAPLKQAHDAVLVDTSELDLEQSIAAVVSVIEQGL